MKRLLCRVFDDTRGAALIEFALLLPFMALLLFGGVEATNYILVNQRVEKAGYVLADITTQFQQQSAAVPRDGELTEDLVNSDIFPQLERVMGDGANPANQRVILTSLRKEGGTLKVKWQITSDDGLSTDVASQVNGFLPSDIIGIENVKKVKQSTVNLPPEVASTLDTMVDGQNIVVCELFVRYKPIASAIIGEKTLEKKIFLQPRNDVGQLVCLPPNYVYPECTGGPPPPPKPPCGSTYCDGADSVTRDCNGTITSTTVCADTCRNPVSACDGNDYVTKLVTPNCPDVEKERLTNHPLCVPVCSPAAPNDCSVGVVGNINPGSCGGNATWTCTGAGGGVANCSMPNAACPPPPQVDGKCGAGANGYVGPGAGCPASVIACETGVYEFNYQNIYDPPGCAPNCMYGLCTAVWKCKGTGGGQTVTCFVKGDFQ